MSIVNGKPAAYVCENFTCQAPVTDVKALAELLKRRGACAKRLFAWHKHRYNIHVNFGSPTDSSPSERANAR